jgi:hypothetical protein
MPALTRPQKITFGELRDTGARAVFSVALGVRRKHR